MEWVTFYYKEKELSAYDFKHTFPGELDATKKIHAEELGCCIDDIEVYIVEKKVKKHKVLREGGGFLYVAPVQ